MTCHLVFTRGDNDRPPWDEDYDDWDDEADEDDEAA